MRLAALALVASLSLGACGLGEGEAGEGEATLTVTRDYGAEELVSAVAEDPPASDTVMRFLDREADIETRYGGGFVQSLDGIDGEAADGRTSDWFFYVDGLESPVGAAEVKLDAGMRIWWDYHDWTDVMRVPAVVGSWPAPFTGGEPANVPCAEATETVCGEVVERIEGVGGQVPESGGEPRSGADGPLVLVGAWEDLRRLGQAAVLGDSPSRSGVFASFEQAGDAWELATYDETLRESERLGPGTGLVAAVENGPEESAWIVTGTDPEGVDAAAAALDSESLANRFAIAVPAGGEALRLPVP